MNDIVKILRAHRIRPTKIRQEILQIFFNVDYALSHADIQQRLMTKYDRVTVYRTLELFEKNGFIHKIVNESGGTLYGSHSFGGCDVNFRHHQENHLHFKCTKCGHIYCMCSIKLPHVEIPEGFELPVLKFTAEGICKNCRVLK